MRSVSNKSHGTFLHNLTKNINVKNVQGHVICQIRMRSFYKLMGYFKKQFESRFYVDQVHILKAHYFPVIGY